MKKIFYSALAVILAAGLASCSEEALNTAPTTSVSTDGLYESASTSLTPLNGIYRSMYTAGWSTGGNTHQCFGISAYNLAADVMGEDHIMSAQGSGWFWYDALYNVKGFYTSSSWRPYDLWNAYYTWIANANYIIAAKETMTGSASDINYVVGQAYAIRAYSYFMLAQSFCRTYKGHETDPGVPIYTERTELGTAGKPRGTVEQTYAQINADIDTAIARLSNAHARTHKSHIDLYVASGLKARICLVQENWAGAEAAADVAIKGAELTESINNGMNSLAQADVLWGAEIVPDQSGIYASFFMHMCGTSDGGGYGNTALKQINRQLYKTMGANDLRRAWWIVPEDDKEDDQVGYLQNKFRWTNESNYTGDYIWMRVPEMYLTKAEAQLMSGNEAGAKETLSTFMKYRDSDYSCAVLSGTEMGNLTTDETGSLREEIIRQRRIELWGEYGRIYDIRRLRQGFERTKDMGWPSAALLEGLHTDNPESWDWVLNIPQAEFDANEALDQTKDQNPMDSGI